MARVRPQDIQASQVWALLKKVYGNSLKSARVEVVYEHSGALVRDTFDIPELVDTCLEWGSEERVDVIGQNGNDGLHYEE
jgi:hypothetical protein